MKIACPHCGQHYEVEDSDLGAEVACEKCGTGFVASPMPDPEPVEKAVSVASDATSPEMGARVPETAQVAPVAPPNAARGNVAAWSMFMYLAACIQMFIAVQSSLTKDAIGLSEIFLALSAIFTLLARPRLDNHASGHH